MEGIIRVIDAHTGAPLRDATSTEIRVFWTGQTHPYVRRGESTWTHRVRLSPNELVEHYNGPGIWFGGAGF